MVSEERIINNIRVLASEVVSNAKSGHTGIVLSSAPILFTLFAKHLKFSDKTPNSIFRDRFVLSAGHGSSLLYTVLHCFGYNITKEDLKNFRKLGSKTSGHPEVDFNIGIECTTGPLGQGVATAVGMAIANKKLREFNKKDCQLFDNKIYTLIGDGCLMEGVSFEALSLAGTLNLDNLIVLYDSNNNTLDSATDNTLTIDVKKYVEALGFEYLFVKDGNNIQSIDKAISKAKKSRKPAFIEIKTLLGYGSRVEGKNSAHGLVMDESQIAELKQRFGVNSAFLELENDVRDWFKNFKANNNYDELWRKKLECYKRTYHSDFLELKKLLDSKFTELKVSNLNLGKSQESTRNLGNVVLNLLAQKNSNIIGGNADLSSCTKAHIKDAGEVVKNDFSGRNIFYGVREFAMGCIANGLALSGFRTFAGTFMVFSDYLRSAIRSSAIMKLPIVYIFSHDSIAVGEDGPTHQPIEHLDAFRAMPNLNVFRPCNVEEMVACYNMAFSSKETPSVIALTRQPIELISTPKEEIDNINKGAYVIDWETEKLTSIIIATGSEVPFALKLKEMCGKKGQHIRIVSVPCLEIFDKQTEEYKNYILPKNVENRVCIEAGTNAVLSKLAGNKGKIININTFGVSASMKDVYKYFGLTVEDVIKKI